MGIDGKSLIKPVPSLSAGSTKVSTLVNSKGGGLDLSLGSQKLLCVDTACYFETTGNIPLNTSHITSTSCNKHMIDVDEQCSN